MVTKVTPVEDYTSSIPPESPNDSAPRYDSPARSDISKRSLRKQTGLFEFANIEAIKDKVREAKLKPPVYNVHDMYHETGMIQFIAKHPVFENTTLSIICINAVWIWIDTDYNKEETINTYDVGFAVADSLFFVYFSIELIIRFLAFKRKRDCLRDAWFVFDSLLVALYCFDPFVLGIIASQTGSVELGLPTAVLRLLRLARLSRLIRMLRSLPELMILVKGMLSAIETCSYAFILMLLITYVFAIALRNLVDDDHPLCNGPKDDEFGYFESVPEAMHSLIIFAGFLDDLSNFIYPVKDYSTLCFILVIIYICLASLTVMNMLIGVLCAVIEGVAAEERESMSVDKINDKFSKIAERLDANEDKTLSWDEFVKILDFPDALEALESVNIDPEILVDAAEDFFWDDGQQLTVTFDEFMGMLLDLRGGQPATVKDIMCVSKRFSSRFIKVQGRLDKLDNIANQILNKLGVEIPVDLISSRGNVMKGTPSNKASTYRSP